MRRLLPSRLWLLASLALLAGSSSARAGVAGEGMHSEIRAERATTAPVIDGLLGDAIWSKAAADDSFTQQFPLDGEAPSMRTTVQVAFDDKNLYFGINSLDPEPGRIAAPIGRRDSLVAADFVEVLLDTRHDHDNGYLFRVNAAGVLADGEIHDDNRINFEWDAVWTGKAQTHGGGWSAELAIPLSVLRFSSTEDPQFGLNVKRNTLRTGEIVQWIHIPRTSSGTLSRAGHIVGLSGIAPRRAIELRPFGVVRIETALESGGSAVLGDAHSFGDLSFGIDAKLGLTEGLTLDSTINPDFGQVEADPVVLNLSTFETFFPEKRPFFLEGAGMLGTDIRLIHSRRIGERTTGFGKGSTLTLPDGSMHQVARAPLFVPIYAAARVSGTAGNRFSVNALSAVTGPESVEVSNGFNRQEIEVAPAKSYSAVRGKYSLKGSSYLGFVATSVARLGRSLDPEANHDAFAESVDGRWVRSDGMYRAYFQVAAAQRGGGDRYQEGDRNCSDVDSCRPITRADGSIQARDDVGGAGEFGGAKAGGPVRFYGRYRFVSPDFDVDDMGFENNWDYHQVVLHSALQHERRFLWFQRAELAFNGHAEYGFDHTRRRLDLNTTLALLANNFWTGNLLLEYKPAGSWTTRETSDAALFERSDEARISFDIESDARRNFSGGFGAEALTSPSTELRVATTYAFARLRPSPPFEVTVKTDLAQRTGDLRVLECLSDDGVCWLGSMTRDYTLALQDTRSLNVTARASLAISTELSLEGYMQIFAAGVALHDYRAIYGQQGAHPQLSRGETEFLPFDGDIDRDGDRDDRFSFAALNANFVLRWEMFPGTTLIGVYTRAQRHNRELDRLAYQGLRRAPTEEILLLKLTLFAGL